MTPPPRAAQEKIKHQEFLDGEIINHLVLLLLEGEKMRSDCAICAVAQAKKEQSAKC